MKKHFFLLTMVWGFSWAIAIAQAPQAFSYQAVATDDLGRELTEQAIGIRASILQGSPSGPAVWVETHALSTDEFGLFTIPVGQGAAQGGGAPSFAAIDWNAGPYFLRIDLDAAGGTNYIFVGATQLMSVPYALYGERAGRADAAVYADSAAVAQRSQQAVFADSAAVAHRAQEAIEALHAVYADTADFSYLANQAAFAFQAANADLATLAATATLATTATFANNAAQAQYADTAGTALDDLDKDPANELQSLSISGDTVRISDGNFITLSSASIFNAPGATLDFPEGTENGDFVYVFNSLTVPAGKNFYITASQSELRLPGVGNALGRHFTSPSLPMAPAGTTVASCRCVGFLIDQSPYINPVVIVLQPNGGNSYQVPPGRYFVIKSGVTAAMPVSFDNAVIDFFSAPVKSLIAPGGVTLRNPNSEEIILTGYLKNNN
ncbi:MAG: hypothetical protein KF852_09375 [Saprospiraceae bacterium]|nr:hypothetical protein [Saprospiraceae bacterium]